MGTRFSQIVLIAVLSWLALSDAKAGCTEPAYVYGSPYSHITVYRACDTYAELRAACSQFADPFRPYYGSPGCFGGVDAEGRRVEMAGHYRINGQDPYYFAVFY